MPHAELVSIVQNQKIQALAVNLDTSYAKCMKQFFQAQAKSTPCIIAEGEFLLSSDTSKKAPSASALTWEIYSFAQEGWELHEVKKWGKISPFRCALLFVHFVLCP